MAYPLPIKQTPSRMAGRRRLATLAASRQALFALMRGADDSTWVPGVFLDPCPSRIVPSMGYALAGARSTRRLPSQIP